MFINAKYNGADCLLNTDYIVDIFDFDKIVANVYTLDCDREPYKVMQAEIKRMLEEQDG